MNFRNSAETILYYGSLILIIVISILYYAPVNYFGYNSDHAVHVLMSKDFQLPRDYFYWGQNRLGSLLPLVSSFLGKFLNIHFLYICSIVQYLFLGTGFLVLAKFIKQWPLRVALCAIIFLPVNEYNALILIGHPYSSQLFTGSLFVLCLYALRKHLLSASVFDKKDFLITIFYSFLAALFLFAGIWVSEFNAILVLIPVVFLIAEKDLRAVLFRNIRNRWFISSFLLSVGFVFLAVSTYKNIKKSSPVQDSLYDKALIDNVNDVKKNIGFFLEKLDRALLFKDDATIENLFSWFLIALCILLVVKRFRKENSKNKDQLFTSSLLIVSFVSCIVLFLSTWNLRSEFSPRYFTPVYVMFCYALILRLDGFNFKKGLILASSSTFVLFCVSYCYTHIIRIEGRKTQFENYGEFRTLPKGTLIGEYWDAYKINSIAIDSLQSLPFDHNYVRNWAWREIPLAEKNFYFLKNENELPGGLKDTIKQFDILFKYSGVKYKCNGIDVLLYHKLIP